MWNNVGSFIVFNHMQALIHGLSFLVARLVSTKSLYLNFTSTHFCLVWKRNFFFYWLVLENLPSFLFFLVIFFQVMTFLCLVSTDQQLLLWLWRSFTNSDSTTLVTVLIICFDLCVIVISALLLHFGRIKF